MATRSTQFFITTAELESLVREVANELGLTVILSRRDPQPKLEIADQSQGFKMADGQLADQLFLSMAEPDLTTIDVANLRPGELGWVQLDAPREIGNTLYLVQMAAKSDWFNDKEQHLSENPAALALYAKFLPHLRRDLKSPCWGWNIKEDSEPQEYPNVRYTKGAKAWEQRGGELRQEGVKNVRFSTTKHITS